MSLILKETTHQLISGEGHPTAIPIKVAKIGVQIKSPNSASTGNYVLFSGSTYHLLTEKRTANDIKSVPEFSCRAFTELNERTKQNEVTLWVVLHRNFDFRFWENNRNFAAVNRLIDEFFVFPKTNFFDEHGGISEMVDRTDDDGKNVRKSFASQVESLYENLQDAHAAADRCNSDRYADDFIRHEYLQVKLKPYQVKTIKWMLDRERTSSPHINNGFVEVKRRAVLEPSSSESIRFFYNPQTATLTTDPNALTENAVLPTGGILAEQMGMGKTIEILDLILLNPRTFQSSHSKAVSPPNEEQAPKSRPKSTDVKCLCCRTTVVDTVACTNCAKHQHRKCVDQRDSQTTPDIEYICPGCWQSEERIPVKTTLVVSPQSIKNQWKTEVETRIQSGKLSILVYAGSKSCKWISPRTLASYDIILTDYETFRTEFMFTGRNKSDRVLRSKTSTIKLQSPLLNLNFWRICLDESQMVVDMTTKHALLISDLSAVHRWAVTGTPIEKSLDDLFGLLSYINYAPYNSTSVWRDIVRHLSYYPSSDFEPLIPILQPIMRRTCKTEGIMHEMDVPEQVQQVHYIELGCLSRYQYNQERDHCRWEFKRLISAYNLDTPLTSLSPHTLDLLLEPVRKLRRDCSILHVSDEEGNTIVMRPSQMLQYLISKNQSDAKVALKAIATKMKSFVQLSLGDHAKRAVVLAHTTEIHQSILDWAKAYEKEPSMIDSLLQLQIVHNVSLVNKAKTSVAKHDAEWTSLSTILHKAQQDVFTDFNAERKKEIAKLNDSESFLEENCGQWISAALTDKLSQAALFGQIRTRTTSAFENVGLGSLPDITNTILYWCNELLKHRKTFLCAFDVFLALAESKFGKEKRPSDFFSKLVRDATDCHLNNAGKRDLGDSFGDADDSLGDDDVEEDDDDGPSSPKKMRLMTEKKKQCILCSTRRQLDEYGMFISDKAHKMTKKTAKGSEFTNPSFQEFILTVILQSNEYLRNCDTKVGMNLLNALENFRDEFQKHKNLLNSITKTVANFHLLQKRKRPKPTKTYCDSTIRLWRDVIEQSKTVYGQKVRVNRYLNCMKRNADEDECSICMMPNDEYIVFECGHQCCSNCFKQIVREHDFECPFCRQVQSKFNVHHFTCDRGERLTDSTSKIEQIVRKVFELLEVDPKVKILIFSQWTDILLTLKNELSINAIASRCITSGGKALQTMVADFKDPELNITCLLLPYRLGSRGINLIEATNVFLIEPIINRGDELQTLGRVHRIGQTRQTCVHRFITRNTIEETIFKVMSTEAAGILSSEKCTVKTLVDLFADTNSDHH